MSSSASCETRAGADDDVFPGGSANLNGCGVLDTPPSRGMTQSLAGVMNALFPGLQLARQWKQLGCPRLDDTRGFGRSVGLAEVQFLNASGALFDLVGRNQNLPDVLVGLREMVLQLQHALAQAS